MKTFLLITGLLLLFAGEILRVYFIMPFPGSQTANTISIAYWLNKNIIWVRLVAMLLFIPPLISTLKKGGTWKRIGLSLIIALYALIFFYFNYRFQADKIFYQPRHKNFADEKNSIINERKLVLGVMVDGIAKAYPIQMIGYHHQVMDTIGNTPIMITYCTVCRTGRVYSPVVSGKPESFRLVGMDHFNAMFEDARTKSWWRQATGIAIAGPLKGTTLKEIHSQQLTLTSWLRQYPNTLIMQPDSSFIKTYRGLTDFDKGTIKSNLEKRDSGSWKFKSWVVGIAHKDVAKAYDWNELLTKKMIQDSLAGMPILLVIEKDSVSFNAYNRFLKGNIMVFDNTGQNNILKDLSTASTWNIDGLCIDGVLKGEKLEPVQAYQEFWHSWNTFHPNSSRYTGSQ